MRLLYRLVILILSLYFFYLPGNAQGTWVPLNYSSWDLNGGVMLLLSDGSVMTKTLSDTNYFDENGNIWDKLTPDINGSYINGTWTQLAPMYQSRCYFSSQILKDGRVYIAGGEYGTGGALGEIYDPLTDSWTQIWPNGDTLADASSEMLPDGRVLEATMADYAQGTLIFNPVTNLYTAGPDCGGDHDEASWLKLPDNSILFVDFQSRNSERYIPALNSWITDANLPVDLYDTVYGEDGAAFLLPNGKAFFLGASGHTAYYTPSGSVSPGVWSRGPSIPNKLGTPDAPAAMMANGKILCAFSDLPTYWNPFPAPTWFYEFDYTDNIFTLVSGPEGPDTLSQPCYTTTMLNLPDGTILFGSQGSDQYYIYQPDGEPVASGMPIIENVVQQECNWYSITGTLFNGISEGSVYGDDWQMATNYPIVQLSSNGNVYYARTFNWNRTGVQTGDLPDTTFFTLPDGLPSGNYSLAVIANGISSNPVSFAYSICVGIDSLSSGNNDNIWVYPNPAVQQATLQFMTNSGGAYRLKVEDISGRTIREETGDAVTGNNYHSLNVANISSGLYLIFIQKGDEIFKTRMLVN